MNQRKNILVLSSWYPTKAQPFLGNFVEQQIKLIASIHSVTVIVLEAHENASSIRIEDNEINGYREIRIHHPKGKNSINRYFNQRKAIKRGLNLLEKIDLIHAHVLLPKGHLFAMAKKKLKCPLIVTEHASYYNPSLKHRLSTRQLMLLKKIIPSVDRFIAVSNVLKQDMEHFGIQTQEVVPNPIDSNMFRLKMKEKTDNYQFLHISTLAEIKNVRGIIDAFNRAYLKNQTIELTIVSDEDFSDYQHYALTLDCAQNIQFVGPVFHQDTVDFYQNSDCFILNSEYETFSIVVAEAWSCGKPVIATNVGIAKDMQAVFGIQIEKDNPKQLAQAMIDITTKSFDPNTIREHALQFDKEHVLAKLNRIYDKI